MIRQNGKDNSQDGTGNDNLQGSRNWRNGIGGPELIINRNTLILPTSLLEFPLSESDRPQEENKAPPVRRATAVKIDPTMLK